MSQDDPMNHDDIDPITLKAVCEGLRAIQHRVGLCPPLRLPARARGQTPLRQVTQGDPRRHSFARYSRFPLPLPFGRRR